MQPGEATTARITRNGEPVSGATVEVGERTYETGSDGTVMFDVPADVEEPEVVDAEAELERTFGGGPDGADGDRESGPDHGEGDRRGNDGRGDGQGSDGGAEDGAAA